MDKINFPREIRVYIPLVILFFVLLFLLPRAGKFNYEFKKGQPWMYEDFYARFDAPINKSAVQEEEDKAQVRRRQPPFYYKDASAEVRAFSQAEKLPPVIAREAKAFLKKFYAKGLCDRLDENVQLICCYEVSAWVDTLQAVDVYTLNLAEKELMNGAKSLFEPDMDTIGVESGLQKCLIPNLLYDESRTRSELSKALDDVAHSSGSIYAGDRIIAKGEIVTAKKERMLKSYQMEFDQNHGYDGNPVFLWLGNGFISLLVVFLLFFSILFSNAKVFLTLNRYYYLVLIVIITQLMIFFVGNSKPIYLYVTPFSLMVLFLLAFFRKRVVLPVYIVSLLPMLLLPMGVRLFFIWTAAGVLNIFTFTYWSKGWRQFVNAFFTFLLVAAVFLAFEFTASGEWGKPSQELLLLFIGSFLPVAGYPFIFLFEKVFSLVSNYRLDDLSDTNSPLLQLLFRDAPGTYQHSVGVMNMSEAVARAVGANVSLTRAGALYHDVGKIQNPKCFVENGSEDFHKERTYEESAQMIISHVKDGLKLADKYGLPEVVKTFIRSHHGTSCTGYFYGKFIEEGGNPDRKSEFCYPGPIPRTAEETIVMICDSVEAASRTLANKSDKDFSELVDRIVDGKMKEGQFADTELTLHQLKMAKEEICNYLCQVHHPRITYPNTNNINK